MPAHLNDGGFAEIICNWEEHRDQPWEKRLAGWVSRKDCDAWILRNSSSSAESYSRAWLSDVSPENFKQKTEEWINYFNDRHVSSVGIGMIVMRLAEGRDNWIRVDSACPKKLANAGKHVERIFELQSYINSIPENADLLERRFTISPFSVLEQRHQPGKKGWQYTGAQLSLTEGIASTVQLNQNTVKLIVRCDGNKSIGNLLAETVEPDQKEAVLEQVRNLVMLGFLWPNELCSTKESEDCLQAGNGKDLESGIIQNPSEDRRNLPDVKIHRPNQHLPVNRIVSKFLGSRGVSI